MKITKRQLKKLINEEKARLTEAASITATDNLETAMDEYVSSYLRISKGQDMSGALASLSEQVEGYIEFQSGLDEPERP
ncbi:MAG: hypothetical protein CMA72_06865 [Euryarchaeota archaeon]|nr:hypothetical protein [Euryarchaeota archaeon]|tara:strand:+ start:6055 stop:6291 length:237 start_codon:yes stop_codon:yes gene_type:complete